ncbi:hypothetical protein EDB89DRAFT_2228558 [Lactarius sanguifluus]|nr:hypothetical protein EDB89DRAFT_2228558 [Lactarius sanguifluus]
MLDSFSTPNVGFVWGDDTGKKFLTKQLRDGASADDGVDLTHSDSARLQNIMRFLMNIGVMLCAGSPSVPVDTPLSLAGEFTLFTVSSSLYTFRALVPHSRAALVTRSRRVPDPGGHSYKADTVPFPDIAALARGLSPSTQTRP